MGMTDREVASVYAARMQKVFNTLVMQKGYKQELRHEECRPIVEELLADFPTERWSALLAALEWAGTTGDMPGAMHLPVDSYSASCPACGGIRPPNNGFIKSAWGHRTGCPINAMRLAR